MDPYSDKKNTKSGEPQPPFKKVSALTSLASYPYNIDVRGKNDDEILLLFVREHKVTLFFNILFYSVALFVPYFIEVSSTLINKYILNEIIPIGNFFESRTWLAVSILWIAFMLRGYFNIFFKWFYNINILTNNRLMDIDFLGIFSVGIEETSIKSIEDVKDRQVGIVQSIFNMGDIEIYTASGKTLYNLDNVPKAYKVRDFIMDVVVVERKKEDNA